MSGHIERTEYGHQYVSDTPVEGKYKVGTLSHLSLEYSEGPCKWAETEADHFAAIGGPK